MRQFPKFTLAGAALTMLLVSACGSGTGTPGASETSTGVASETASAAGGPPITINYWTENATDGAIAKVKALVSAFNASHPNIVVVVRYVTTEFRPVIRNAFAAGNPPEIFDEEGYNDLFDYVKEGQIEPVTEWFNANKDRFGVSTVASVTYDNKVYAVPELIQTANSIWYNKKVLSDNGIDPASLKTWDDMLAAFAKLKGAGVSPLAFAGKDGWPGSEWYFAFLGKLAGGVYANQLAAGNCGYKWTDPVSVQAAQKFVDLQDKGYFAQGATSTDYPTANAVFLSGKAGFYMMGSWFVGDVLGAPNKDNFGMLTFPNVPGGKGGQESQLIAPQGFALTTSAADPAKKVAALTFIDFMTQTDAQSQLATTGAIMANPAANTAKWLDPYSVQISDEQVKVATASYSFLEHQTTKAVGEDAIWKGSTGVLTGQLTAQSWMESVQKADDGSKGQNPFKVAANCTS